MFLEGTVISGSFFCILSCVKDSFEKWLADFEIIVRKSYVI